MEYRNNLDSTNYERASFATKDLKQMVYKRNDMLIQFAEKVMYDIFYDAHSDIDENRIDTPMKFGDKAIVRLIGKSHQPSIIINNEWVVSIFVNNFDVFLSTTFKDGDILTSINLNLLLTDEGLEEARDEFREHVSQLDVKQLNYICDDNGLMFSSFDKCGHAYFSKTNPQLFYTHESAMEKLEVLERMEYLNLDVI